MVINVKVSKASIDIDFALFEKSRPPMYTAMKYWGKKPNNIWNEYISTYTPKNGIYLDPFSGSAMSAFEAIISGRKATALDLNPLTSFIIEVFTTQFDEDLYRDTVLKILTSLKEKKEYKDLYCYHDEYIVHNVKYEENIPYEVSVVDKNGNRSCKVPNDIDILAIETSKKTKIEHDYPNKKFHSSISFSNNFLKKVGTSFSDLYTNRNLIVLSMIFDEILREKNSDLKKQLLYTFIKVVHLSTKMCVPRGKKSNRSFSTSWGRSAYIYTKKQMEMNPVMLFESAAFGKQSTVKALQNFNQRLNKRKITTKKLLSLDDYRAFLNDDNHIDLLYGTIDIKNMTKYLTVKSVDFILTDPPYGGLVQYLDLSSIWLSWLELYDDSYTPIYDNEITINHTKSHSDFEVDMSIALSNISTVLKDNGKVVLTFNNKDLLTWKSLLKAIEKSGLKIEKVIHQQNKRTGESNVSDPFGSSASDFYIRCVKSEDSYLRELSAEELDKVLLDIARDIIKSRGEPTPYQILFNGVLANMSLLDIDYRNVDNDFNRFLKRFEGSVFTTSENLKNKAGNYWWLKGSDFNIDSHKTLTKRVESFVTKKFETNSRIKENTLYENIYKEFPNGLTPDPISLNDTLKMHAFKKGDYWIRKDSINV